MDSANDGLTRVFVRLSGLVRENHGVKQHKGEIHWLKRDLQSNMSLKFGKLVFHFQ